METNHNVTSRNLLLKQIQKHLKSMKTKLRDVAHFLEPFRTTVRPNGQAELPADLAHHLEHFRHSFDEYCANQGLDFKFVFFHRNWRTLQSIHQILKEMHEVVLDADGRTTSFKNYLLDRFEEVLMLFAPYQPKGLSYDDRCQRDSTYNMITRPCFWMATCVDIGENIRLCRNLFPPDILHMQTNIQYDQDHSSLSVIQVFSLIFTEAKQLKELIEANKEALDSWTQAIWG